MEQVEKDYSKITVDPTSRQQIESFAKLYNNFIPISVMAMKGFISLTLRDFQVQTHVEATQLLQMAPSERAKHFETLSKLLYEKLTKVLVKPEQKAQLLAAIREAMQTAARL